MKTVHTSPWQRERAARLHLINKLIEQRTAKGETVRKAVKTFSRRWNRKPLKSDPCRRYTLSEKTLYRLYLKWRRSGKIPSALLLNYASSARRIPAPVLVRFIELCAKQQFDSFRAAWRAFCTKGQRAKIGYDSLRWNLPRGSFANFKRCWRNIRQAQRQIQMLRLKYTSEIRARVPDRLPRRGPDFQI